VEQLGAPAAVARARAFLEAPPVTLRLNPRAPDPEARFLAEGLRLEPGLVPGAWRLVAGRAATLQGEGVVYVQDEGSQLVARLAAGPGRRLDACAAPGGKALLMGDLSEGEGTVVAADVSPRRLALMKAAALRWRSGNVLLLAADGRRPPFRARFAAVLLDAPCSGLGTNARHPDIRWRARAEDLPGHARRQRALLDSLAPLVEPGGRLVYSVCSAEPEETEQVVGLFLAANPGFRAEPLPEWAAPFAAGAFLRTSPERHGGDAFFAALLGRA
jgi:16S rRNA (cytosine967-C5)-methyltransferase